MITWNIGCQMFTIFPPCQIYLWDRISVLSEIFVHRGLYEMIEFVRSLILPSIMKVSMFKAIWSTKISMKKVLASSKNFGTFVRRNFFQKAKLIPPSHRIKHFFFHGSYGELIVTFWLKDWIVCSTFIWIFNVDIIIIACRAEHIYLLLSCSLLLCAFLCFKFQLCTSKHLIWNIFFDVFPFTRSPKRVTQFSNLFSSKIRE